MPYINAFPNEKGSGQKRRQKSLERRENSSRKSLRRKEEKGQPVRMLDQESQHPWKKWGFHKTGKTASLQEVKR